MQQRLESFVPAADEVWRLHHGEGPECDLFRTIAEQGHYAGRTVPTDTRQGIYATSPSGRLLASVNTRSARAVRRMLDEALERWEQLGEAERYLDEPLDDEPLARRWERLYPSDGLVLRVASRDLPRGDAAGAERDRDRWKRRAWNFDYAWFRADEAASLVPDTPTVGAATAAPDALVRRLARLHFVDNVRGQTEAYAAVDVRVASLTSRVVAVDGPHVALELDGRTHVVAPGTPAGGAAPDGRGATLALRGRASYDTETARFESFELAAVGTRWGGTRYNGREHDLGPAPIAFALTLADGDPPVAPAFVWEYGW